MRRKKAETAEKTERPQSILKEEDGTRTGSKKSLLFIFPALLPVLVYFLYMLITQAGAGETVPGVFLLAVFGLTFFFVFVNADIKGLWRYDNAQHKIRFAAAFLAGICLTVCCSFFEPLLWLYMPFAVILLLLSELPQAMGAFLYLLFLQQLLSGPVPAVFTAFALAGTVGMLLFYFLDEQFLFGLPLFCALLFQTLILLLMEFARLSYLTALTFLYAGINLVVSFFLLTAALKILSSKVIHKDRDRYAEINDPESELLSRLKQKNVKAYYHAVHTAHFCEQLARRIGADEDLAKAGGYYHKIGRMRGDSNLKNALQIADEYAFPEELVQLLKEYGGKSTPLKSKEAGIVLLSDAMVSSVMFLFEKNKDAGLNYEQIASVVFSKQLESGLLDECELTLAELSILQKCFMEERLYYDFLR